MRKQALGLVMLVALLGAFFMTLGPHAQGATVQMGDGGFVPVTVRLPHAGSAVTFLNRTRHTHTATCPGCPVDTGDVQPGEDRTITFGDPGTFVLSDRYGRGTVTVIVGASPSPSPAAS